MIDPESKEDKIKPSHPLFEVFEMYIKNLSAVFAMIVLIIIVLTAIFGPSYYPTDPFDMVWMPFLHQGRKVSCWARTI